MLCCWTIQCLFWHCIWFKLIVFGLLLLGSGFMSDYDRGTFREYNYKLMIMSWIGIRQKLYSFNEWWMRIKMGCRLKNGPRIRDLLLDILCIIYFLGETINVFLSSCLNRILAPFYFVFYLKPLKIYLYILFFYLNFLLFSSCIIEYQQSELYSLRKQNKNPVVGHFP